ncbi:MULTISPECIES: DMT family transporter [Nocardiopsis]|uniref:DMT family transporter n=1 Tax=Nocardiopsis changdeensis TaxID=2831969 RepID=A0ABX8BGX6_9ACTN|nr:MULTISPECIES: DMT family transporter [Nocardiopsis]QUX21025.1 DMT family transporter [Nocardiopsis changdeensis]QYX36955.1 DMT family transporter [Nocardiopsis sp. MT53]
MRRSPAPALLAAGLVVMWSSGFVGAELGTRHAPAETLLAWRFLVVAGPLAAWCLWARARSRGGRTRAARTDTGGPSGSGPEGERARSGRMTGRDAAGHAAVGALAQAGYLYGVFAAAGAGVAAGTVALIAALQPLVATALAVPLLGERVRPRQVAGLALGLAGVGLVVGADLRAPGAAPWWGYALPVGAMLSLVAATLLERRLRPGGSPAQALAVQCGVSAVLFTALAAATGTLAPPADPGFWAAVAWVVVLSTVGGYGLYWAALARFGVARVSALLYLTPPTTLLWSLLMFGDPVGAAALAGLAVCAAAVVLVTAAGPGTGRAGLRRASARAGRRGPPSRETR